MTLKTRQLFLSVLYAVVITIVSGLVLKFVQGDVARSDASVKDFVSHPNNTNALEQIGGLHRVKKELMQTVQLPLKYPHVFYGASSPLKPASGVLFHGPPGTGKTMLATAIAAECKVPFMSLHSAALESKWFGESPKLIEAAFRYARQELSPCIIFFDEIDGLGRSRTESDQSCVYSLKCELLRTMDSIVGHPVMVLACTNCPQNLDPALRRRFTKCVNVPKPDASARHDILTKLFRDERVVDPALLVSIVESTEGFSGSDLKSHFVEASSNRFHAINVEGLLSTGTVQTGDELVAHLGPLAWEHWSATGLVKKKDPPKKTGGEATPQPDSTKKESAFDQIRTGDPRGRTA